jgi:hypothetical protein
MLYQHLVCNKSNVCHMTCCRPCRLATLCV